MPISTIGAGSAAAAGPVDLIYSVTAGSGGVASFDTSTIDVTAYRSLELTVSLQTDDVNQTAVGVLMYFNGDETAANYYGIGTYQGLNTSNSYTHTAFNTSPTSNASIFAINADDADDNIFSVGTAIISSPSGAYTTSASFNQNLRGVATNTDRILYRYGQVWKNTDAITRIVLKSTSGGNFVEGSTVQILGVK